MSVCQRDRFPCRTSVVARNVPRPDFAIQLALLLLALSSLPSLSPPNLDILARSKFIHHAPPNLDILAHSKFIHHARLDCHSVLSCLSPNLSLTVDVPRKFPAMIVELDIVLFSYI